MKRIAFALAFSVSASAAFAGVPTMVLPDLTFPPATPDISTQGCVPTAAIPQCR